VHISLGSKPVCLFFLQRCSLSGFALEYEYFLCSLAIWDIGKVSLISVYIPENGIVHGLAGCFYCYPYPLASSLEEFRSSFAWELAWKATGSDQVFHSALHGRLKAPAFSHKGSNAVQLETRTDRRRFPEQTNPPKLLKTKKKDSEKPQKLREKK